MNILYKMLGIDMPVEYRDGFYYCGDIKYRDQVRAKKVYDLQKFVDSISDDKDVIKFIDKYKCIHDIIVKNRLNKLVLLNKFRQFVKAKMGD